MDIIYRNIPNGRVYLRVLSEIQTSDSVMFQDIENYQPYISSKEAWSMSLGHIQYDVDVSLLLLKLLSKWKYSLAAPF